MTQKERYEKTLSYFKEHLPEAKTELAYRNPYELLVAVILSAQCTDKRVNQVTPILFKQFPNMNALSNADFDSLFPIIKSISYPNSKAGYLVNMAKIIVSEYEGAVPMQVADLVKLPGVGRKTANVITSVIDHQPNMAVDTHVFRVSRRIGLVSAAADTVLKVEKALVKNIPGEYIHLAHHWLILHGRYTCLARNPKCSICDLALWCRFYSKK